MDVLCGQCVKTGSRDSCGVRWRHTGHVDGVSKVDSSGLVEHPTCVQAGIIWRHTVQLQRQPLITITDIIQLLGVVQLKVSRWPRPWTSDSGASAPSSTLPATVWMPNACRTKRSIGVGERVVVVVIVIRRRRRRRWCGSWRWQHLVVLEPLDFHARPADGVTAKSNWVADRQRHFSERVHRLKTRKYRSNCTHKYTRTCTWQINNSFLLDPHLLGRPT